MLISFPIVQRWYEAFCEAALSAGEHREDTPA